MTTMDVAAFIKSYSEKHDQYTYGLRYGEFIALLVDQVQKLKERISILEDSKTVVEIQDGSCATIESSLIENTNETEIERNNDHE